MWLVSFYDPSGDEFQAHLALVTLSEQQHLMLSVLTPTFTLGISMGHVQKSHRFPQFKGDRYSEKYVRTTDYLVLSFRLLLIKIGRSSSQCSTKELQILWTGIWQLSEHILRSSMEFKYILYRKYFRLLYFFLSESA